MRWAFVLAVVFVGCVASVPNDPSISADLATETARMILVLRRGVNPPPAPDAGNKCDNCQGSGKVRSGDGIEFFTCPVCEGTGKAAKSAKQPTSFVPLVEKARP